ncbi:MAG TPA: hypothetical protein VMW68_04870 [Methyloceanibacter sp.]|nr:hypothetical protein [Methyloceanibacter sp.]
MGKIVTILVLTALAMFMARMAYDAPMFDGRLGATLSLDSLAQTAPPLMYAGVRG